MKGVARRFFLPVFLVLSTTMPLAAHAQVANFVFTSQPQIIAPGVVSQQLTVQAQDSGGASFNIPSTACLSLTSTSAQGQFSSSATNWTAVSVLTMNKNTANKNFYYQDSQAGTPVLTVKIALKPDSVTSSCANWSLDQWSAGWTATQTITIGAGSSSGSGSSDSSSSNSTSTGQTQTQTETTSAPAPTSSYVAPPVPDLYADAGPDRTVIVGADTTFNARAYDKDKNMVVSARFMWNFGDGATAEGESVLHHYEYPGRYALVLNIAQDKFAAMDEAVITAEPAKLSFSAMQDGGVEIDNLAGRDLDLSGWLVRVGPGLLPALFTLPPQSVILSGSSMHITKTTLGFTASSEAELQYPNGVEALQAGQTSPDAPVSAPAKTAAPVTAPAPRSSSTNTVPDNSANVPPDDAPLSADDATAAPTSSAQAAAAGTAAPSGSKMWWIAAGGLAAAAGGSLVAARRFGKKEWDIIEEK